MLEHYDDILYDGYQTEDPLPADEYNSLVRIVDAQVVGALHGVGEGVIEGGEVTAAGALEVAISAFAGVIETEHGHCYVQRDGEASLTLPDEMTLYIWAVALLPADGDYDSRESGVVRFQYSQADTQPTNGIPLATVVTASGIIQTITDTSDPVPAMKAEALAAQVSDLETAVGIPYGGADDLDQRVTDLEDGAAAGGGYQYWRNMPKEPGDETTPTQEAEQIADDTVGDHLDEYHEGETAEDEDEETRTGTAPWDIDAVNQARALLRATLAVDPDAPQEQVASATIVWNVYGDGNGIDDIDYVDRANSDWLPT